MISGLSMPPACFVIPDLFRGDIACGAIPSEIIALQESIVMKIPRPRALEEITRAQSDSAF